MLSFFSKGMPSFLQVNLSPLCSRRPAASLAHGSTQKTGSSLFLTSVLGVEPYADNLLCVIKPNAVPPSATRTSVSYFWVFSPSWATLVATNVPCEAIRGLSFQEVSTFFRNALDLSSATSTQYDPLRHHLVQRRNRDARRGETQDTFNLFLKHMLRQKPPAIVDFS